MSLLILWTFSILYIEMSVYTMAEFHKANEFICHVLYVLVKKGQILYYL